MLTGMAGVVVLPLNIPSCGLSPTNQPGLVPQLGRTLIWDWAPTLLFPLKASSYIICFLLLLAYVPFCFRMQPCLGSFKDRGDVH